MDDYGVTCHHMVKEVDRGKIISIINFPVDNSDDVESLLTKTYQAQLDLFSQIIEKISLGKKLPLSKIYWSRIPYTRKEFEELLIITPEMSHKEVRRRIKAMTYDKWGPIYKA